MVRSEAQIRTDLDTLVGEVCASLGLEIVEVKLARASKRWHLRIDIDRPGPEGVGLDDCQRVSRTLEAKLDEWDPIDGSYTLEVSSPGVDRPIRTPEDFKRNTGRKLILDIDVEDSDPKRITGDLLGMEDGRLKVREEERDEVIEIDLAEVARARQYTPF